MSDSLDAICAALREHGYTVAFPEDRAEPAAIATPDPEASTPPDLEGGLALEPVGTRSRVRRASDPETPAAEPTRVVDALAAAAARDLACLFVVDERGAAAVRDVLTDPPGVRAVDADGCRAFYDVPDRLSTGDGLACVRAEEAPVWREEATGGGITDGDRGAGADDANARGRTGRDTLTGPADGTADPATRLVLEADGDIHAAFDDYDALACPTAAAFPYTYRREADKRVHVRNRDGREVGVYPSIRAMKADAYRPVPDPLIPEVHLDTDRPTAWRLAIVDGPDVRMER